MRHSYRYLLPLLLLLATPVSAQIVAEAPLTFAAPAAAALAQPNPDLIAVSYDLNVYTSPGATVPSTRVIPASAVQCDLATSPTGDSVNPTIWWFRKFVTDTTWCRADDTQRLNNLPIGSYEGTVIGVNAAGTRGMETARVPFTRTVVTPPQGPPAPSGLKFSK